MMMVVLVAVVVLREVGVVATAESSDGMQNDVTFGDALSENGAGSLPSSAGAKFSSTIKSR